ncbi:DedA family protein [Planotetraspora phitsanulokensis]|uniref:Membrane protein n=1 Tax=Planotetraspora phitsanulokensis TaxID=575192 RepID=A0A8J3XCV5_9ACTN|nr:DedA family protein [Planotetraspora phitsanulokensis]GII35991.1 membrane protein [Planotetraspora phitsanulokensis]
MADALNLLNAPSILATFGTVGVFVVLFAETGLLIGFVLPGDSLLFTAGLLCTTGAGGVQLSLPGVLASAAAGALLGAQTGYLIGRRAGGVLLSRTRNRHLLRGAARAEELLSRYGHGKAIVLARFIPLVRTVLNPLAGAVKVPARIFTLWQIIGGLLWTVGLVLAGYALGSSITGVDRYLLPLIGAIVALSLLPLALEILRSRTATRSARRQTHR